MTTLPIIQDKFDLENARRLVNLGYPAVAESLPGLLEWIQDMNWPVAKVVAPFLASIGRPLRLELMRVLQSEDLTWKYGCISAVIAEMPLDASEDFEPELRRLAQDATPQERHEGLDDAAKSALDRLARRRGV